MGYVWLVLGTVVITLITSLWKVVIHLIWRPYAITRIFKKQGVEGPRYNFLSGSLEEIRCLRWDARGIIMDVNNHDYTPRILPHFVKWMSQHGETFLYWIGAQPRVCITDPELVKQILSNKFGFFTKKKTFPALMTIVGRGLLLTEGSEWARHRRVVSPAFTMDKLKMMTTKVAECAQSMLDSWHDQDAIEVGQQFKELTADVISHTAFGSSYKQGKEVFLAQNEIQDIALGTMLSIDIPGFKYLPTRKNLRKWKLKRRVKNILMSMIQGRLDNSNESSSYGNDLLGLMMEACRAEPTNNEIKKKDADLTLTMDEIIDECKTFFFAGHETTSHLLTWTMFLLSTNQEWQQRLREEVMRECGMGIPTTDELSKLKLVTMVLFEAMRLYSPVLLMLRMADRDMNLGSLMIPKGTSIAIPILIIHQDKEVWGDDADKFNPLRFENGINKAAKHPNAFLSFSLGPRACVGQNFAMLEAKTVMAMILRRFSFSLSPEYKHAPIDMITLQPQFGLPIVMRSVHQSTSVDIS